MSWIEGISPISFPGLGIEINPPAGIAIGNFSIQFYGILIGLGLMLAVLYGWKRCNQFGIKQDDITDGVLYIAPFAIVCARLFYCIFEWEHYASDPISVLYIWNGGLAIFGGVIGAIIGMAVYCYFKKINLPALLDLVLMGFLIGQVIGRWGNFMNREAYGAETDFFLKMGLFLDENRNHTFQMHYFHPTFLYESLWNTIGFVGLHFLSKKRQYDGQIALGYALWYGVGRAIIEGLRTDSLYWGPLRINQIIAAVICVAASVMLFVMSMRKHTPDQLYVNRVAARNAEPTATEEAEPEVIEETEEAKAPETEE